MRYRLKPIKKDRNNRPIESRPFLVLEKDEQKKYKPLEYAQKYKEEWNFIKNIRIRENISYNLQYIEFLIKLYNEHNIGGNIESLLCKTIILTTGSILESALYDLLFRKKREINSKIRFYDLIKKAYKNKIITDKKKKELIKLKDIRNLVHIKAVEQREYEMYKTEEVNQFLNFLENFRKKFIKK